MFQVTKMNEKENKKKNDKAFWVKRESLYLTAIYNGWGFREIFGDKRGFGEGWGLREYLWWGFGELSRLHYDPNSNPLTNDLQKGWDTSSVSNVISSRVEVCFFQS
jgi:hypothetical protein